jgi:uncharacterized protein YnzC (UPF0291/DUF896 family)
MTYQTYTVEETYSYEVYAETPAEALEQFDAYREESLDEFETDTKFLDNSITIYDSEGKEVTA